MVTEVAPDIFRISQKKRSLIAPFSVNTYVIAGENGLVFDAGMGGKKAGKFMVSKIKEIEKLMKDRGKPCKITRLFISHGHWDHFSGAYYLRKKLGLTVLANNITAKVMTSRKNYINSMKEDAGLVYGDRSWFFRKLADIGNDFLENIFLMTFKVHFFSGPVEIVTDRQILSIAGGSWELRLMPGHSDDDMILVNNENGVALSGDIVLRKVNTWLGPPRSDLTRYLKALDDMSCIDGLKIILPAHGSPVTEPYKRLREASEYRKKRTLELLKLIEKHGRKGVGFSRILKIVYPRLKFGEKFINRGWVLVTLLYLIENGLIVVKSDKEGQKFTVEQQDK